MNEAAYNILLYVLSYTSILVIGFFVLNWLSNNFLWMFLRIKFSRGRLVLVRVRSALTDYFKGGHIVDNDLDFKDVRGQRRIINLPADKDAVFRTMNVNAVDVHEATNTIITKDFSVVSGHDSIKTDNLLTRALTRPVQLNKFEKIILLLVIVAVIVAGISAFFSFSTYTALQEGIKTVGGVV